MHDWGKPCPRTRVVARYLDPRTTLQQLEGTAAAVPVWGTIATVMTGEPSQLFLNGFALQMLPRSVINNASLHGLKTHSESAIFLSNSPKLKQIFNLKFVFVLLH